MATNIDQVIDGRPRATTANSRLAIGGVLSPLDSFVVTESSVLRTNVCAEKLAHRQSANRYRQAWKNALKSQKRFSQ